VFVGLDLLLWMWNRRLYPVAMGTLVLLTATSVVTIDLFVNAYAVLPLVLLIVGRKRYMAAIPEVDLPQEPRSVA
jgi:hypothetical protein